MYRKCMYNTIFYRKSNLFSKEKLMTTKTFVLRTFSSLHNSYKTNDFIEHANLCFTEKNNKQAYHIWLLKCDFKRSISLTERNGHRK